MENVKRIPLSGKLGEGKCAVVSACDFEWASQYTWHSDRGYAYRTAYIDGRKTTIRMHREVMGAATTKDNPLEVDHINGDTLDNRRINLRFVTRSQNEQNAQGARSDSSTGVRGVFPTRSGRYRARIWINGKSISLGTYDTIEKAEHAATEGRARLMTHAPESRHQNQSIKVAA